MFRMGNFIALTVALVSVGVALAQSRPSSSSWSPGQAVETSLLFHPTKASEGWVAPPANSPVEDVWLKAADGNLIHAWWLARSGSQGVILFCHGNAGNLSYWRPAMASLVNKLGQSVLIFDYPGYGRSEGKPSESGCYAAAACRAGAPPVARDFERPGVARSVRRRSAGQAAGVADDNLRRRFTR